MANIELYLLKSMLNPKFNTMVWGAFEGQMVTM